MILHIIKYGNKILRKKSKIVKKIRYKSIIKLIDNMFDTLFHHKGLGLSAPQIGENLNIFITNPNYNDNNEILNNIFINSKIINKKGNYIKLTESCLSIPNITYKIYRKDIIYLEYYNINFEKKKKKINGICSRIIQHEYDHLNGILFIDRIKNKIERKKIKFKLENLKKNK